MRLYTLIFLSLFCSSITFSQSIVYVDASNTSATQDGTSWSTAYADLQDALDVATNGDSLFLAAGTYTPSTNPYSSPNPRLNTFFFGGTGSFRIIGGFDGTESSYNDRDPDSTSVHVTNASILSGDLGIANDTTDDAFHVVTIVGGGAGLIFEGITITDGNANDTSMQSIANTQIYNDYGGGVYATITEHGMFDVVFEENRAKRGGGGIYVRYNAVTSQSVNRYYDCTFSSNRVDHDASQDNYSGGAAALFRDNTSARMVRCFFHQNTEHGSQGGGAIRFVSSTVWVQHSTFTGNRSSVGDGGAAVYCAMGSAPQFDTCTFKQNFTADQGGAVYCDGSTPDFTGCLFVENEGESGAGAVEMDGGSDASYSHCTFIDNQTAADGGAVQNWKSSPSFDHCQFISNSAGNNGGGLFNYNECSPWVSSTVFQGNSANQYGGGIYNRRDCNPVVVNCLIYSNSAGQSGGGVYTQMSNSLPCSPNVTNSTITQNIAGSSGGGAYDDGLGDSKLWNSIAYNNSSPVGPDVDAPATLAETALRHSMIGNEYYIDGTTSPSTWSGQLFLNAIGYDFHLAPSSPAIDLGDSTVFDPGETPDLSGYALDLDGLPRTMGWSTDLGAYESCGDTATTSSFILALPSDTVDSGEVITFINVVNNLGVPDSFAWLVNGTSVPNAVVDSVQFTTGVDLFHGDEVVFWYDAGNFCVAPDTGRSNTVMVTVLPPVDTSDNDSIDGIAERMRERVVIFPNPVEDQLTIHSDVPLQKIRCYNPMGQLVLEHTLGNKALKYRLDVAFLPSGWYAIVIEGDGLRHSDTFFKP